MATSSERRDHAPPHHHASRIVLFTGVVNRAKSSIGILPMARAGTPEPQPAAPRSFLLRLLVLRPYAVLPDPLGSRCRRSGHEATEMGRGSSPATSRRRNCEGVSRLRSSRPCAPKHPKPPTRCSSRRLQLLVPWKPGHDPAQSFARAGLRYLVTGLSGAQGSRIGHRRVLRRGLGCSSGPVCKPNRLTGTVRPAFVVPFVVLSGRRWETGSETGPGSETGAGNKFRLRDGVRTYSEFRILSTASLFFLLPPSDTFWQPGLGLQRKLRTCTDALSQIHRDTIHRDGQ